MTYNEKKSLYESIMKEIAKTVRDKLNEFSQEEENRLQTKVKQLAKDTLERRGYKVWDSDNLGYMRVSVKNYEDEDKIQRILTYALRPESNEFGSTLKVSAEHQRSGYLAAEIYLPWYTQCRVTLN